MNPNALKDIAKTYGTPVYVYDGETIEQQYHLLKSCLPESFDIFYSVKSNPLLGVCQLMKTFGSNIEVASLGELHVALEAGFDPCNIIFTSPGKTYEDLEFAIDQGIFSINAESLEEVRIIHDIALLKGRKVPVSLRINPNFNINGAGLKMTGVPTQFGIDQTQVDEALNEIALMPQIEVLGFHIFSGSQMLEAGNIIKTVEEIFKLVIELSDAHSLKLKFLDLGGGFGIPYFNGEKELDTETLRSGMAELWAQYGERLAGARIGVESGRFLLAKAGVFLTKVLYVKESKGTTYVVCDGGSNHHSSAAFLGRYVRNNFPMFLLDKEGEGKEVNVVGSLCTPTDVIGQRITLVDPQPGDLLIIDKSGAYGLTHSPVMFLSHVLPAEVLVYQGSVQALRERSHPADFLRGQHALKLAESLEATRG